MSENQKAHGNLRPRRSPASWQAGIRTRFPCPAPTGRNTPWVTHSGSPTSASTSSSCPRRMVVARHWHSAEDELVTSSMAARHL